MKKMTRGLPLMPLLLLGGCAPTQLVTSVPTPCAGDSCISSQEGGLVYSLPRALMTLTATRTAATAPDLTNALALVSTYTQKLSDQMKAFSHAQKVVNTDNSSISDMNAQIAKDQQAGTDADTKLDQAKDDAAKKDAQTAKDKAASDLKTHNDALKALMQQKKADETVASAVQGATAQIQELLTAATSDLNRQRATIANGVETASFAPQPTIGPDPRVRLVAKLRHSGFRDDDSKIAVSSNGLLASMTTTSTDQTLASLQKIFDSAVSLAVFSLSGIPIVPKAPGAIAEANTIKPFPVDCSYALNFSFDPLDPEEIKRVNKALTDNGANFSLKVRVGGTDLAPNSNRGGSNDPIISSPKGYFASSSSQNGLYYRVTTTATVSIIPETVTNAAKCPLATAPTGQSIVAVLPDSRADYLIPAEGDAFTKTVLTYNFVNGMPADIATTRQSVVAAAIALPIGIANDIIQIPTQVIQLRLNFSNNTDSLEQKLTTQANDSATLATAVQTLNDTLKKIAAGGQSGSSPTPSHAAAPATGAN